GSKSADLRVQIEGVWGGIDQDAEDYDEDVQVAFFIPAQDSNWVEGGDGWIYYQGGPVPGTYDYDTDGGPDADALEPETVTLCLVVAFDGPSMGNAYQGAGYTLSGTVEAVQGTNGAAEDLWDLDMEAIKALTAEANTHYDYFQKVSCYTGSENGDEPGEDEPGEYAFNVGGLVRWNSSSQAWELSDECGEIIQGTAANYGEGAKVTLVVKQNPGYVFQGWSTTPNRDDGNLIPGSAANYVGSTYTYEYTMPADSVTLYAIFNH
ncbi:MAG: hypothetical protein GX376_00400, partial [Firmicutes bacterium]|nr:hypothetical protein [Bacillota bacterium]